MSDKMSTWKIEYSEPASDDHWTSSRHVVAIAYTMESAIGVFREKVSRRAKLLGVHKTSSSVNVILEDEFVDDGHVVDNRKVREDG